MIRVWIDGAARPNPGKGGIGVVIRGDGWDYTLSEAISGKVSNNQAEYLALSRALHELIQNDLQLHDLLILSDSEMLVEQMSNCRSVDKGGAYVNTYTFCARDMGKGFTNLKFKYIPREENSEANLLASRGVKNGMGR